MGCTAKIYVRQQHALDKKTANATLGSRLTELEPSPLLCTGKATPGAMCPVLGSSVHRHTAESATKGHEDHYGTATSLLRVKAERAGAV